MTENQDLEAMASNPHTDWDVLHWIAENHPELRPAVAANPGTYQELVDALAGLQDPEIDEAIAQRSAIGGVTMAASDPEPDPEPEPELEPEIEPVPEPEPVPESEADTDPSMATVPEPANPDALAGLWNTGSFSVDEYQQLPAETFPVGTPDAEPAEPEEEPERRHATMPALALVAFVGAGLAIAGAIALFIMMLLGDDEAPTAEPTPDPEPTEAALDGDEDEDTDGESEDEQPVDEEAISEARAAVEDLPGGSSCDIDDDAGVVASLLTAAGPQEGFPGGDDAALLESTFGDLQSECSTSHAAGVFEAARSGSQAPEGGFGDALTSVGTDWADRSIELGGAEVMGSFSAQDGNVQCEFGEGLTCTVYETDPEHCDEGATYRMTVDEVDVDCDAHLEPGDRDTLSEDDSATDGFLVCVEMSDRLSCYNTLDPFGFEVSSTGNYSY